PRPGRAHPARADRRGPEGPGGALVGAPPRFPGTRPPPRDQTLSTGNRRRVRPRGPAGSVYRWRPRICRAPRPRDHDLRPRRGWPRPRKRSPRPDQLRLARAPRDPLPGRDRSPGHPWRHAVRRAWRRPATRPYPAAHLRTGDHGPVSGGEAVLRSSREDEPRCYYSRRRLVADFEPEGGAGRYADPPGDRTEAAADRTGSRLERSEVVSDP